METQTEKIIEPPENYHFILLGRLMPGIVHEVNNALNILGFALDLIDELLDDLIDRSSSDQNISSCATKMKKQVKYGIQSVERICRYASTLRDASITSSDLKTPIQLSGIIDEVLLLLSNLSKNKCTIERKYPKSITCPGRSSELFQLLLYSSLHMITNCPTEGSFTIEVVPSTDRITIEFRQPDSPSIPSSSFSSEDLGLPTNASLELLAVKKIVAAFGGKFFHAFSAEPKQQLIRIEIPDRTQSTTLSQ